MDVSAVSLDVSITSLRTTQTANRSPRPFRTAMDAAAKALGMTPSDLMQSLQGGQSLADLAAKKGMSQDDLVRAMAAAIGQANPNLSADQATRIATRIATAVPGQGDTTATTGAGVSGVGGHHHHRGHHHSGDGSNDILGAVSQALGESTDQVSSALRSGQSLADLAKSKGVSVDDVIKALAGAFQSENPNLSADQATQMATEFATASSASGPSLSVTA